MGLVVIMSIVSSYYTALAKNIATLASDHPQMFPKPLMTLKHILVIICLWCAVQQILKKSESFTTFQVI